MTADNPASVTPTDDDLRLHAELLMTLNDLVRDDATSADLLACAGAIIAPHMAEIARLRDQAQLLVDVAVGRLNHIYNGLCPDEKLQENVGVTDPTCPACRVIPPAYNTPGGQS